MRRSLVFGVVLLTVAPATDVWGWSENTHRKLTAEALRSVSWLDGYRKLKATPFAAMVKDVLGSAAAVGPDAFRFKKASTRRAKHRKYLADTASIDNPTVRRFARHLLLSSQLKVTFALGEQKRAVSAKQILSGYSGEPDWGMDKGLDASSHQKLMGGTDPAQTSSQGFRHMSFLFGKLGESPRRAQLCFDLGRRAIQKGHPYWGFRFVAWGLHYLQDMGTPVHTNMLPTLKYIRLKGMLRPKGAAGRRSLKAIGADIVKGSTHINANYHFLYERYIDRVFTGRGADGRRLAKAVRGKRGERDGLLSRLLAPRSIKGVAKRRAWSRLSTPGIARAAIRFFTGVFRRPAPGAPSNTVRLVNKEIVERTVVRSERRLPRESQRQYRRRLRARAKMIRSTTRQFRRNGRAIRRAVNILGRKLRARR